MKNLVSFEHFVNESFLPTVPVEPTDEVIADDAQEEIVEAEEEEEERECEKEEE